MARRSSSPGPSGLIQVIHLRWGKLARGGQSARDRTTVPQAFVVESGHLPNSSGQLCVESTLWDDRDAFSKPLVSRHQRLAVGAGFRYGCVDVSAVEGGEGLVVHYLYDQTHGGAPDRWYFNAASAHGGTPGRDFLVEGGDWVRVCYNGRFSCIDTGTWWYEQVTVNVAWFLGAANGSIFLERAPAHDHQLLAKLR